MAALGAAGGARRTPVQQHATDIESVLNQYLLLAKLPFDWKVYNTVAPSQAANGQGLMETLPLAELWLPSFLAARFPKGNSFWPSKNLWCLVGLLVLAPVTLFGVHATFLRHVLDTSGVSGNIPRPCASSTTFAASRGTAQRKPKP